MITIDGLKKSYGSVRALKGVSFTVGEGDFFGLLGPNGAGKSTLMHILTGFIRADAGTVQCGGLDHTGGNGESRRLLGFVPQHIAVYQECTAWENLGIFGRLNGLSAARINQRGTEVLERVRLLDRAREPVHRFSGGMQRRLNLAIALLHEPQVLLCDEPTVGIDPHSRNAIFEFLEEINRGGMTVVYTTHYMEEVQRLCNRIGIIDDGRLIALGTLNQLLDQLPYEEEIRISAEVPGDLLRPILDGFGRPKREDDGTTVVRLGEGAPLSDFFARVERAGLSYRNFRVRQPTLEALFLHLTGRTLRD